jgi:hypothetical protein
MSLLFRVCAYAPGFSNRNIRLPPPLDIRLLHGLKNKKNLRKWVEDTNALTNPIPCPRAWKSFTRPNPLETQPPPPPREASAVACRGCRRRAWSARPGEAAALGPLRHGPAARSVARPRQRGATKLRQRGATKPGADVPDARARHGPDAPDGRARLGPDVPDARARPGPDARPGSQGSSVQPPPPLGFMQSPLP